MFDKISLLILWDLAKAAFSEFKDPNFAINLFFSFLYWILITKKSVKKLTKVNSNNVTSIISQLEKEMYNHAKNLEFEQAAKIRDQINELQQKYLMFPKAKS